MASILTHRESDIAGSATAIGVDRERVATRRRRTAPPADVVHPGVARVALVQALDMAREAVFFLTPHLQIVAANLAALKLSGYGRRELLEMSLVDVVDCDCLVAIRTRVTKLLRNEAQRGVSSARLRSKDGTTVDARLQFKLVDGSPDPVIILTARARRKTSARRSPLHARHDYLTGLPSRATLDACLRQAEQGVRRQAGRYAVLFIDTDGLKVINDVHGHHVGDLVLIAMAERLAAAVRPDDLVARFGGDEFVIVVDQIDSIAQVQRISRRIREAISAPLEVEGKCLEISASVGRAIGDASTRAGEVLRQADLSMYRVKRARRNRAR